MRKIALSCTFVFLSACGQIESTDSGLNSVQAMGHGSRPAPAPTPSPSPSPAPAPAPTPAPINTNALVPDIGFSPGNPAATEDRVGPTGVLVPGRCPPTQDALNAQVALKNPQFPTGTDLESRIQRFEKTLSALQDLQCPAASTTLLGRLKSLTALRGDPNLDAIVRGLDFNETPAG